MTRMFPMMPRMRMMAKEMGTKKRVSLRIMISLSLFILVTSEALSVSTEFVMCSITSTPIMITSSAAILLLYTLVAIGAEKNVRKKCEIMRQLIFCAETCLKELDWHFNITTKRGCERAVIFSTRVPKMRATKFWTIKKFSLQSAFYWKKQVEAFKVATIE